MKTFRVVRLERAVADTADSRCVRSPVVNGRGRFSQNGTVCTSGLGGGAVDELLPDAFAVLSLYSTCTVTGNLHDPHANFDFHESPTNVGGDSICDSGDDWSIFQAPLITT